MQSCLCHLKTLLSRYSPCPFFSQIIPLKATTSSNLSSFPSLLSLYIKCLTSVAIIWLNLALKMSNEGIFDCRYALLSKSRICSRILYPSQFLKIMAGVLLICTIPRAFSESSRVFVLSCIRVGWRCVHTVLTKSQWRMIWKMLSGVFSQRGHKSDALCHLL